MLNWGSIITSAITAILFTGTVNYVLQKNKRKGDILIEKGFILINEIFEIEDARIKALVYCTVFEGFSKDEYLRAYEEYSTHLNRFTKIIKIHDFLLDERTKQMLNTYIEYLKQPQQAILDRMENKDIIVDVDNYNAKEVSDKIIKLIKKQMI